MAVYGEEYLDADIKAAPAPINDMLFYVKQLERAFNSLPNELRTLFDGTNDPQAAERLHRYAVGGVASATQLQLGTVMFSYPTLNVCRVLIGGGQSERWCVPAMTTASSALSTIDVALPAANSQVILAITGENPVGYILGVLPPQTTDAAALIGDYITQGTSIGASKEQTYRAVVENCLRDAGARDYAANRPLDQTAAVRALLSPLGGGLIVDLLMCGLRADERCGVWFHYLHRLARLAGENLDIWTAGSQEFWRNDGGEIASMRGVAPYAWEALGRLKHDVTGFSQRNDAATVQTSGADADREPLTTTLAPFWRVREYAGYLGQGGMREVVVPPESDERNAADSTRPELVVFRESVGLDGSYSLISAKSLAVLKRSSLPSIRLARMPEDPQGDTADNYATAGLTTEGEAAYTLGTPPAAPLDTIAHAVNWKSVAPFVQHVADYTLAEPSALPQAATTAPDFTQLSSEQALPAPTAVPVRVDHRQPSENYYETTSGWLINADGSVSIIGPAGQSIVMGTDGSIRLSAPADMHISVGRQAVVLAGDDVVLRANRSVDVTSTTGDLRLKAENNLEAVSGCSGVGRLLLENKATTLDHDYPENAVGEDLLGSGIVLRASNARLQTYSAGVYMRTGGRDSGIDPGNIVLDAGIGTDDVVIIARDMYSRLESSSSFVFPANGDPRASHTLTETDAAFAGTLTAGGALSVLDGGISASGDVRIKGGHITTEFAGNYDGRVNAFDDPSALTALEAELQETNDAFATANEDNQQYYEDTLADLYAEGEKTAIGAADLIAGMAFSYRDEAQYGTQNLILDETHWQQLARTAGNTLEGWSETAVDYKSQPLMPWPGYTAWTGSETGRYRTTDLQLHDPQTGRDVDRAEELYETRDPPTTERRALQDNYPIIPFD